MIRTGADSVYFDKFGHYGGKGAYSDPTSPYRNWYTFTEYPDEYECWWGVTSLPNVREEEPSYVDFIMDGENAVATHWLDRGASGWRLDVADELPMDFLRRLRKRVKARDPEAVLIGEVWEDASNKVSYGEMRNYCAGDSLDSVMNYPLREALMLYLKGEISAEEAASRLSALYENYPKPFAEALMNLIGSHDRSRVINALVGVEGEGVPPWEWGDIILTDEQRKTGRARMLRMLIFSICMPGIPCVYYGDEVGMEGLRDPYNRCPYPWGEEDQEAFSAYSSILRLRRDYLDMPGADTRIESAGDVLILRRMLEEERLICAIAPGARNFSLCAENADEFYDLESAAIRPQQGLLHFHIPECGYAVFRNG